MPRVVAIHAVEDVQRWLSFKDDRAAAIESMAGRNLTEYVAQDGSNNIAVSAEFSDLDGLSASLASPSPELAAMMQQHGVVPPLTVYVEA